MCLLSFLFKFIHWKIWSKSLSVFGSYLVNLLQFFLYKTKVFGERLISKILRYWSKIYNSVSKYTFRSKSNIRFGDFFVVYLSNVSILINNWIYEIQHLQQSLHKHHRNHKTQHALWIFLCHEMERFIWGLDKYIIFSQHFICIIPLSVWLHIQNLNLMLCYQNHAQLPASSDQYEFISKI